MHCTSGTYALSRWPAAVLAGPVGPRRDLVRAEVVEDLDIADRALQAIDDALASLAKTPFLFRKATGTRSTLRRELVISHGASGYVLKYEIASPELVVVLAVRHQLEADFH